MISHASLTAQSLGKRVELVSMDPHFHNITIALYRDDRPERSEYIVHTYSQLDGARDRIEFILAAMATLGGIERAGDRLYFSCGSAHGAAARRTFLEACKLAVPAEKKHLAVLDKKSGRHVSAESVGAGIYRISADGPDEDRSVRVDVMVNGLRKLAELTSVEGTTDQVVFSCGHAHDALIGLLLPRALNVRATLREDEAALARGLLAAPSQQKS